MPDYYSWLVVDTLDMDLRKAVPKYHKGNRLDFDDRPKASLRRDGNKAVLQTVEAERLFAGILKKGDSVLALSLAPAEDVSFFDRRIIQTSSKRLILRAEPPPGAGAYGRRFLSICFHQHGVETKGQPEYECELDDKHGAPETPDLFLDPQRLNLDQEAALALFGGTKPLVRQGQQGAFLLPPCRSDQHSDVFGSYFDRELLSVRKAVRRFVGTSDPLVEPSGQGACRLTDDPMLRDLLLDGGSLEVAAEEGGPTKFHLSLPSTDADIARDRLRFFLEPDSLPGPRWVPTLAREVACDLRSLAPGHFHLQLPGEAAMDWSIRELGVWMQEGDPFGTHKWYVELKDALATSDKDLAAKFSEHVTVLSASRDGSKLPDSGLADRRFLHFFWRQPWGTDCGRPDNSATDPWRNATIDIVDPATRGKSLTAEDRIRIWNDDLSTGRRFVGDRHGGAFVLRYTGDSDPDDLMKWRLELPVGATISKSTFSLDHKVRSILDSVFVLG